MTLMTRSPELCPIRKRSRWKTSTAITSCWIWGRRLCLLCPSAKGVGPGVIGRAGETRRVLGKLGNTGNTSAPHLHFHLMESPSVLGSNGIPYLIDSFAIAGQIPAAGFAAATGVEGNWSKGLLSNPNPRHDQFPLDLDIVDF